MHVLQHPVVIVRQAHIEKYHQQQLLVPPCLKSVHLTLEVESIIPVAIAVPSQLSSVCS